MAYQFGRLVLTLLTVCIFQTTVLAGKTNRFKIGMVITDIKDKSVGNRNTSAKYTCNAARTKISMNGYKNVGILRCDGNVYQFSGQSNSKLLNIGFNAYTGEISII